MTKRSKKASPAFVPAKVVGSDAEFVQSVADTIAAALDTAVESASPEKLRNSTKKIFGVAIVAETGEDELVGTIAQVEQTMPTIPIVVAADRLDVAGVRSAFRAGARDVMFVESEGLSETTRSLIARREARTKGLLFAHNPAAPKLIGAAPSMVEVSRLVEKVAAADATVLLLGESGTGKELIARAVHAFSPRSKGPFVAINCAAIPETLLENELFGHEKGAYTGANATAIGKVEAADKGTLFLDEIGEMPIALQAKILRLLQDRTYDRIGGTQTRKADTRIVAATNRDLKLEAAEGRFREDLYYRLSVVPISLPPLRDRREDVPVLAQRILDRLAESLNRPGLSLSDAAMQRLVDYRWPGNVRELENELERAAVMSRTDEIGPDALELRARVEDAERVALAQHIPLDEDLETAVEAARRKATRLRVDVALERAQGDVEQAARELKIGVDELNALREQV